MEKLYDAIIVGGGAAGLSCAMILGRSRRKVVVFDTGKQRNGVSAVMHGFPSRDGEHPSVFLNMVKSELETYGVRIRKKEVVNVARQGQRFLVQTSAGEKFVCRKLLLATGLSDTVPPLKGALSYYGKGVYHCPYCDGWELRDGNWFVYAENAKAATEVCLRLKTWTPHVTLLSAHTQKLGARQVARLKRNGVNCISLAVKEVSGKKGRLDAITFEDGTRLRCDALFFSAAPKQQCMLAAMLGCRLTKAGTVEATSHQKTSVKGVYVAGDIARDMQLVLVAAAEGAKAGVLINTELNREDRLP